MACRLPIINKLTAISKDAIGEHTHDYVLHQQPFVVRIGEGCPFRQQQLHTFGISF